MNRRAGRGDFNASKIPGKYAGLMQQMRVMGYTHWSVGWLVGWSIGWLVGQSSGWLVNPLAC